MRAALCLGLGLVVAVRASAALPDARTIVERMKEALEPARPRTRKVTIIVSAQHGESTQWLADQAHRRLRVRMDDVRQGDGTEMRVSDVLWDRELEDDLFQPSNLPKAAASPLWTVPPS